MMSLLSRRSVPLCFLLVLAGCSSPRDAIPRIGEIYMEASLIETRNPVIVIHGILGARLEQRSTGKTVWGAFTSDGIDPNTEEGARALALPLSIPASAFDYDPDSEDVFASGPLEALELGLLFTVVNVEIYANIIRALGAGGYTDNVVVDPFSPLYSEDHYTCLTFFYDWRRDNVENAIRLGEFIEQARVNIARTTGNKVARLREENTPESLRHADELETWHDGDYNFDIVAHSMGGLVARYYMRYGGNDLPADGSVPEITWEGAEEIDRLILVGTPNFGAMDALSNLLFGYEPAFILPHFHQSLLSTMPSIYQLLPRNRHGLLFDDEGTVDLNMFDPQVWEQNGWGLLDPESEPYVAWLLPDLPADQRRDRAKSYTAWCLARAEQFHAAVDQPPSADCPTDFYLFASDSQDTLMRAYLDRDASRLVPALGEDDLHGPGDGTVPRYSAVADERQGGPWHTWLESPIPWTNVTFLADDHIGLTRNPHFVNNMLFLLLETQPR